MSIKQKAESAQDRWDAYIEMHLQAGQQLEKLVVHPDDWRVMGSPLLYDGIPVKPLGIEIGA